MEPGYAPRIRAERLIAAGRVVLGGAALLAVWLDPSEPTYYAGIAYSLLAAYVAYAVAVAVIVFRSEAPSDLGRLLSQVFDLVFFSLFIFFTAGAGSPFTAFFVFGVVCATLRWQWRGTLWTALVSLGVFLALGYWLGEVRADPAFELQNFIIRGVYLAVVAVLLGYMGAHEQRTRHEMAQLAAWPRAVPRDAEGLVREVATHSARVLSAPRAVLVWVDGEEPWLNVATWTESSFAWAREPPAALQPWVAEAWADVTFSCDAEDGPVLVRTSEGRFERSGVRPLGTALAARLEARTVLSARLAGETFEGRLFLLDKPATTADDLVLAEVVAGVATARLDHFHLDQRLRRVAATEERIRLARDLHDGVLQSLTGIALRLAAARRLLEEDPPSGRERLEAVQRLIAAEQRDLRFFIEELKPRAEEGAGEAPPLAVRLGELVERVEREWDLAVELEAEGLAEGVPDGLDRDLYLLVREALVNAVRHGEATEVRVRLTARAGEAVALSVADNGRGFPFAGRLAGEELALHCAGPKSLRERVANLHGTLVVDSSPAGARLEIELPAARR